MTRDMEPDDQHEIPTKPLTVLGTGVPSQDEPLTDSRIGAALGAGSSKPSPGAWEPPTPEELQRDFQQYEIRGILGRGGMGAVYKGWQRSLDRLVAIKILPPGLDDGVSDFTERFKREAKAMAHLQHPGIVAVHDAGETPGGLLYFIMECVEGTDVQRLVNERKRLDPSEALRIASAVCDALAYAHAHGVIHRDIKPSNIMLDARGTVKIADFGLAKSTAPGTTVLTVSNVTMGTPDFMAPEALHGVANVDHRADIYAVGVMLYQTLTGKLPRGKYDPPSRVVPGLDKRLDRIVDRALQPEPAARFPNASDMRAAMAPITLSLSKRTPATGSAVASRKRPLLIVPVAAVLAAVAALVHFAPWKKGGGVSPKPATPTGREQDGLAMNPLPGATKDAPFSNTLGQEFVPVPGTQVLFCRWETRVKDYAAFAAANPVNDEWTKQQKENVPVGREPSHPVCGVNWGEAQAFCKWLTEKESAAGTLPKGLRYRLPTDEEWSRAVGLPQEEGATPKERHRKNTTDYPWGTGYPPPNAKVGNYADSAYHQQFPNEKLFIEGYTDGFATTAPVGSFEPNQFGIYDLGGNAWEWCEDLFAPGGTERVGRGASWVNSAKSPLSSSRMNEPGEKRQRDIGFRIVLAPTAPAPSASSEKVKAAGADNARPAGNTLPNATKAAPFINTLGQ